MDRSTSGELAPLPGSKDKGLGSVEKVHDYQVQDLEDTSQMTTPKTSQILICLGSLLLLAIPAFAQPVTSAQATTAPSPITGPALLFDQVSNCDTFGSTSQFFGDFGGGSEMADNFTVPAGMQWEITNLTALGFYTAAGTTSTANIDFYADAGGSADTARWTPNLGGPNRSVRAGRIGASCSRRSSSSVSGRGPGASSASRTNASQ